MNIVQRTIPKAKFKKPKINCPKMPKWLRDYFKLLGTVLAVVSITALIVSPIPILVFLILATKTSIYTHQEVLHWHLYIWIPIYSVITTMFYVGFGYWIDEHF